MNEDLIIVALRKVQDGLKGDAQDILMECTPALLREYKSEVDDLVNALGAAIQYADDNITSD